MILIVGILHTALLKKVLDTFLPAGDKVRLMCKIVFVGYYLLTTAAYSVFHVSFPYEICNLAGIIGVACFYCGAWEKKIWIIHFFICSFLLRRNSAIFFPKSTQSVFENCFLADVRHNLWEICAK